MNNYKQKYFDNLGEKLFDEYMSKYDVSIRKYLIFFQLLASKKINETQTLEIGCGTGQFSMDIKVRSKSLIVLDIGPNLVKNVSKKINCIGIVGDATDLPFQNNSFMTIVSSECIEHTADPVAAIKEMCRICKPGGYVCFTTPNKLWYPILFLASLLGIRKFSGIENWIFPHHAKIVLKQSDMIKIKISGCHLWPFQFKFTRSFLTWFNRYGKWLYPLMINFGVVAQKNK